MKISGVYRILNTKNGHEYIGSSADIDTRWKHHQYNLKKEAHSNRHLQRAWTLYGEGSFKFEVIQACEASSAIDEEQKLLDSGRGEHNLARDAVAPWRGVKRPQSTREKISAAQTGRKQSKETVEKRTYKTRGKKRTEEQLARIKEANANNTPNEECRARQREFSAKASRSVTAYNEKEVKTFASLTEAVANGFHVTSIKSAAKLNKKYVGFYWKIDEPEVKARSYVHKQKNKCKPVEAVYPDGRVEKYDGVNDAMRKAGVNTITLVRTIKEMRPYRGAQWRFSETSNEE